MALLKAYLDDSGDPRSSHLTIGGYVGRIGGWTYFEKNWKRVLDKYDVPYFHRKEFASNVGFFKHIRGNEEISFNSDLIEVIQNSRPVAKVRGFPVNL